MYLVSEGKFVFLWKQNLSRAARTFSLEMVTEGFLKNYGN